MTVLEQVYALRAALDKLTENATDAVASVTAIAFPRMKGNGELVKAGTRIYWNGTIKKAAVGLWDRPDSNPDNAPTLWSDLPYKDGYRIIPEVITVTAAFSNGEIGWWTDGVKYRSKKDNNVYTPAVRPEDWEVAE